MVGGREDHTGGFYGPVEVESITSAHIPLAQTRAYDSSLLQAGQQLGADGERKVGLVRGQQVSATDEQRSESSR